MDTIKEEVVVQDPATGTTSASQTVQHVANPTEVSMAKADKKNQVIWYIVGVINALIVLRILFRLFGAKDTGFASFMYSITDPFVSPFKGIFAAPRVEGAFFDTAAILAIVVISLLGWGISALINVVHKPAPVQE